MGTIGSVDIDLGTLGMDGLILSLWSVTDALEAARGRREGLVQRCPGLFEGGSDGPVIISEDLFDFSPVRGDECPTGEASSVVHLRVTPGNGYLLLCAALASEGYAESVRFLNGWPILSVAENSATVAEAGEASSLARGGSIDRVAAMLERVLDGGADAVRTGDA